ncbi:hypothetical protein [Hyella patelloides]|uniref:hypothetical protein n=1 Tax=Hyella patelloides TaxID=1982969 RepID=UPI0011A0397C|nr:hypothetical protein [Hyella patelloides]
MSSLVFNLTESLTSPEIIYFPSPLAAIKQIEEWKIKQVEFKPNPEIRQLFYLLDLCQNSNLQSCGYR